MNKKKIYFFCHSLISGGGQRVLLNIMNNLCRDKYEIKIILIEKRGELLNFLKEDVGVIELKSNKARYSVLELSRILRVDRPDIFFSGAGDLSVILGLIKICLPSKMLLIGRERGVVAERLTNNTTIKKKIIEFMYRRFMKNLDGLIVQSKHMKNEFVELVGYPIKKMKVINNPLDFKAIDEKIKNEKEIKLIKGKINIVSVGSLSEVKQNSKMIDLMNLLDKEKYHLNIVGDGELKNKLIEYSKNKGLENDITFWGFQENPYKFIKEADLFILTSKHEAFPNVILEANYCGVPAFVLDCPGGIRDLIISGVNGKIFKNLKCLAEEIHSGNFLNFEKEKIKKTCDRYEVKNFINEMEIFINELKRKVEEE